VCRRRRRKRRRSLEDASTYAVLPHPPPRTSNDDKENKAAEYLHHPAVLRGPDDPEDSLGIRKAMAASVNDVHAMAADDEYDKSTTDSGNIIEYDKSATVATSSTFFSVSFFSAIGFSNRFSTSSNTW
jgi:hypothetical protein